MHWEPLGMAALLLFIAIGIGVVMTWPTTGPKRKGGMLEKALWEHAPGLYAALEKMGFFLFLAASLAGSIYCVKLAFTP